MCFNKCSGYSPASTPPWSSSLQVLEAEGCSLQDLSFLETLPNLTEVRLRGNSVNRLEPLGLLENSRLLHLDLADNKLEDLPAQVFKGTELLKVQLGYTHLLTSITFRKVRRKHKICKF